jgi:hypothetical protein
MASTLRWNAETKVMGSDARLYSSSFAVVDFPHTGSTYVPPFDKTIKPMQNAIQTNKKTAALNLDYHHHHERPHITQ